MELPLDGRPPEVTEDADGTISMSVAETNRVRAALGLAPLRLESFSSVKGEVRENGDQGSLQIQERLERARYKRKFKEKLKGLALSDLTEGEDESLLSASGWVRNSEKRMKQAQDRASTSALQAKQKAAALASSQYTNADLEGIKVGHLATEFEAGQSQILTLKDTSLLETNSLGLIRGLASSKDELQSTSLSESQQRREAKDRAKRAKQGAYVAFDDDEFNDSASRGPGASKSILAHYDEVIDKAASNKQNRSSDGFVLGEMGGVASGASNAGSSRNHRGVNIEMSSLVKNMSVTSSGDYLTEAELPTKFKKSKKRRKKGPRRSALEDEEESATVRGTAAALEEALKASEMVEGGKTDHGSRKVRESKLSRGSEEDLVKYSLEQPPVAPEEEGYGDADIMARLSVMQQLERKEEKTDKRDVDEDILERILMLPKRALEPNQDGGTNGKIVLTSTTEFTAQLGAVMAEKVRERASAKHKEGSTEMAWAATAIDPSERTGSNVSNTGDELIPDSRNNAGVVMVVDGEGGGSDEDNSSGQKGGNITGNGGMDSSMYDIHSQPLARSSASAALSLFHQSGDLGASHTRAKEVLTGRAKDKRNFSNEDRVDSLNGARNSQFDVSIEYRDEYGRELTRKEAFRQLSYKFHGYGPGKKKQEKRLKQLEVEQARQKAQERNVSMAEAQQRVQEVSAKPFVMVRSGSQYVNKKEV